LNLRPHAYQARALTS